MKKNIIFIAIIVAIIFVSAIFINFKKPNIKNQPIKKNVSISTPTINEEQVDKTGKLKNSQLIETAKQYILTKPQLYWNRDKFVAWDDYKELGTDFSKITPEQIVLQRVKIEYREPGKYQPPYDNYNDKYIISWHIVPGCEEIISSDESSSWKDKQGRWCDESYGLNVVINPDGTIDRAELNANN